MQEEVRNLSDMLMDKDFEILRLGEKIEDLERKVQHCLDRLEFFIHIFKVPTQLWKPWNLEKIWKVWY